MATVYIPAIYFLIALAYAIIIWGVSREDKIISILGCFLMIGISIYTFISGVNEMNNFVTLIFSAVNIGIAFFVMLNAGLELMKEGL